MIARREIDEENGPNEHTSLLQEDGYQGEQHPDSVQHRVTTSITGRLYVSHFLSTWNSRVFEFGAVLYLATIFPGTLMPMSVYALVRGLSAIIFAPAVGLYIDVGNRLQVVRVSIVLQRLVVAGSCAIFYVLAVDLPLGPCARTGMLVLVTFFACIEKLCSIMNLVAVEKDWVVVIAGNDPEALSIINSQMRRIDLLCKLLGPLFIALIDGYSSQVAIVVNFGMNAAFVIIEYFAIAWVYDQVPQLQEAKMRQPELHATQSTEARNGIVNADWQKWTGIVRKSGQDFYFFLNHRAFLPSIAGAVLYLTVLSFSGQMVTYLLSVGYNSTQIGIARTSSVVFEVLATWVAPLLMERIGVIRAGLWLSTWQVTMLVAGIAVFCTFETDSLISASGLVGGTTLSRLGLRGFDLCVQFIVQEEVEAQSRGAFSSVEAAWQNGFELIAYATTIIWSQPYQFKWPCLISVTAVASASIAYTSYVYMRRGHLLHLDVLMDLLQTKKGKQIQHETGIIRITSESDI